MKQFEQKSLEQNTHGFSRTSWQTIAGCAIAVDFGTCIAGLEPSAGHSA